MKDCHNRFCDFIGSKAFEYDGGWSWEVWQAAYKAGLTVAEARFKRMGEIPMTGKDVAADLKRMRDEQ
jgi:hypothetical protein